MLFGASFYENGDTCSYGVGNNVKTFSESGELILIDCNEGKPGSKRAARTIRFDEKSQIVEYRGPLTCLTKKDTLLLDARNPAWRNLKNNIEKSKVSNRN